LSELLSVTSCCFYIQF